MNRRKKLQTEKMVMLSMLTAIVAILSYLGGFIKIGGLASISLTLIPVVLGAALLGPVSGAWLGLVAGVIFFTTADAAFWLGLSISGTIITVIVKGVLSGLAAAYTYKLLVRFGRYSAVLASAVICPIVNTGVFIIGCLLFFIDNASAGAAAEGMSLGAYLIVTFVGLNFIFELLINVILSPVVFRVINIRIGEEKSATGSIFSFKKYKYETHLHTYPVSACASATVKESLEAYKRLGYDGVFITNHFLDGNINADKSRPYEELIEFYFSDYEEAKRLEEQIGIRVFLGVEMSYAGTDFLIYGLDKEWFLSHPEIMDMQKSCELSFLASNGALVIQAHPYREAKYIDHIRLFPRKIHGVEVVNAGRTKQENRMAKRYAKEYGLLEIYGTDNHMAGDCSDFAGIYTKTPIENERDFIRRLYDGKIKCFKFNNK